MNDSDHERWWMGYEPRHPDQDRCPECGEQDHYTMGRAMQPWGMGIVICCDCHQHYTHVDAWLRSGMGKKFTIPSEYTHRLPASDDLDELYDEDTDPHAQGAAP